MVIALALVELVLAARAGTIPWKRVSILAAVLLAPAVLSAAVSAPLVLRGIPSEFGMGSIVLFGFVGSLLRLLLEFGFALVALALVATARPDAFAAFRRGGSDGRRSLVAAGVAALLVMAARSFRGNLTAIWPLHMGVVLPGAPPGVDTLLPLAVVLESIVRSALFFGGAAALLSLTLRGMLKPLPGRIAVALICLGALARWGAHDFAELLVPLVGSVLVTAAFLAAFAVLLRDDPRAYLLLAGFLAAARGAWDLAASGVGIWAVNGAVVLVAVLILVLLLGFYRPAPVALPPTVSPSA